MSLLRLPYSVAFCDSRNLSKEINRTVLILLMVACCFASSGLTAQEISKEWIEKIASPLIKNQIADGLSIGYIEGSNYGIVHMGSANLVNEKPNNLTLYEIGSISKVFTSLLLADAAVRGEINLNDVANLPNDAGIRFPRLGDREIRWIDLSTHRSGLPRLPSNLPLTDLKNPYQSYDSKKAADFLSTYELTRKPGASEEYSNFAVSVLGYLVAQNANQTYENLLRERIAKPLRMTDCTISLNQDQRKRTATPNEKFGSVTSRWTFADLPGAGGIRATMRDMMRFAKAQLDPPTSNLGEAIQLAWQQHHAADSSGSAMGLGWVIHADGQTRWHNGGTGGSRSAIFINRQLNCAAIVLCNTAVANEVDLLAMQIIGKAAGYDASQEAKEMSDDASANKADREVAIDAEHRARLVGRYQITPDFIMTVADEKGTLTVTATNQATLKLTSDSPTEWTNEQVKATLAFRLPRTGPAKSLVLHQGGAKQLARRIKEQDNKAKDLVIDAKLLKRLEGKYQLTPDFIFTVIDQAGRLMVGITNQATQEVFPDSASEWSYRSVDAMLEFDLRRSGPARSLVLHQNGIEQRAKRIP